MPDEHLFRDMRIPSETILSPVHDNDIDRIRGAENERKIDDGDDDVIITINTILGLYFYQYFDIS